MRIGGYSVSRRARIREGHPRRNAIVCVPYSTEVQVEEKSESQLCQREQRVCAFKYGSGRCQVEVIEDLVYSGSIGGNRPGYERLLTEINQGSVGAVFVHDLSRLSHNTLDFQTLLSRALDDLESMDRGRLRGDGTPSLGSEATELTNNGGSEALEAGKPMTLGG